MIKLKTIEQTIIDPTFVTLAKRFFEIKMSAFPPRRLEARKIIEFYNTEKGFDKFITRLKLLGYANFSAVKSLGFLWVKAETKPLIVDYQPNGNPNRTFKYDIGAYTVYIRENDLLRGNIDNYHFIPKKQLIIPQESYRNSDRPSHHRHLHHYAYHTQGSKRENPLSYYPRTCWGTFGSMIPSIATDGDLPELFRALLMYLTIQNTRSPLVDIRNLSHYERISNEN